MEKLADLELIELSKANLRRTMNEIQDRASSILLLNLRWKDMENVLESAQSSVEQRLREAISKEEEIGRKEKLVKDQFEELRIKEEELGREFRDLDLGKKFCEERLREVELKQKQLEGLKLKERDLEQRCRDVELSEDCLQKGLKDLKSKSAQCEERFMELEAKEKHYAECLRKVELREKEIEELSAEHRRKYEQQSSELEFNVKKCEQRFRDLDLKENKLVEWSNELENKSLALALPQVKNESAGSLSVKYSIDHSSPAYLRFCVYMDGKDLQMFLNERWKEHGSMGTEVAMALQLAADPAKLVLDAMEGFYPPHLSKGDKEFEGDVARRSCILLLEQLMELSPEVEPHVKNEAMKLAFGWITKMRVKSGHELEVLGFLRLLASFQLADAFDADELVNHLVFVAQHIQTPELFKVLGLADKITDFIRKLVENRRHIEAIRFIYAFEQVNEFPPVPVLKDFLSHSETEARTILKKAKMAPKAQNEANTKRVADLRAVVKCIEDHKLESEYLPHNLKSLKNSIVTLEKVIGSRNLTFPEGNPAICTAPVSETSSQQQVGIKRPRELLATEIAGNALLGATTNVSSNMSPKHLKGSKQVDQLENGSKCPRTPLSQMHGNSEGFPLSDLHTNPNRKAVTDNYSWKALARPGDQVSS